MVIIEDNKPILIKELGCGILAESMARSKAILMYKTQNNFIDIPQNIFQPLKKCDCVQLSSFQQSSL